LSGNIDVLARPRVVPMMQGQQRRYRGFDASM
jgi:hypothetical protein